MRARYTLAALAALSMMQIAHAQTPPTGGRGSGTVQFGTAVSLCAYLTDGTTCGPLPAVPNGTVVTDGAGSASISAAPFVGTSVTTPTFIAGSGDNTASPVAGVFRAPNATGTNITGVDAVLYSGDGTGTGGSGAIQLKTASAGSTGSTPNTQTTRIYVDPIGHVNLGTTAGTAWLQLPAGTAAVGTAPLKLTEGVALATPEKGAVEFAHSQLLMTPGQDSLRVFMGNVTVAGVAIGLTTAQQDLFSIHFEAGGIYIFEFNQEITSSGGAAVEIIPTGFTAVFPSASTIMIESYGTGTPVTTRTTTAAAAWVYDASAQYGRIRFSARAVNSGSVTFGFKTTTSVANLEVGGYTRISYAHD